MICSYQDGPFIPFHLCLLSFILLIFWKIGSTDFIACVLSLWAVGTDEGLLWDNLSKMEMGSNIPVWEISVVSVFIKFYLDHFSL